MSILPSAFPDAWIQALDWHQSRRRQGIPTLSVLVGNPENAEALWRAWSDLAGLVCAAEEAHPSQMHKAADTGHSSALPTSRLIIVRLPVGSPSFGEGGDHLAATVRRLCRDLDKLGAEPWTVALALAVKSAAAATYLRDAPDCRAKALFREGLIALDPLLNNPIDAIVDGGPNIAGNLLDLDRIIVPKNSAFSEGFFRAQATLTQQQISAQTLASFQTATAALCELEETAPAVAPDAGPSDGASAATTCRARSAAEQFLYDLLNDLPDTAGLFELNVKLGFCFGPMSAEVDFLAAGLGLVLEIDGYHHFRDPDAYRRDRRKDTILQKQGYLVLRFLAEDVVARLEDVLEDIRTAVAFRRVTRQGNATATINPTAD